MLDLKKLLDGAVSGIDFSVSVDDCSFVDESVTGSAVAEGVITNHSGLILLEGKLSADLCVTCARCGKDFSFSTVIDLNAKITEKLANEDEDEFILVVDNSIDIDDIVRSALILELPTRYLCSEECKGLCPKCGCDLNSGSCSCNMKEHDSRWDVLKDYFGE